jgi:hypothetical protein
MIMQALSYLRLLYCSPGLLLLKPQHMSGISKKLEQNRP